MILLCSRRLNNNVMVINNKKAVIVASPSAESNSKEHEERNRTAENLQSRLWCATRLTTAIGKYAFQKIPPSSGLRYNFLDLKQILTTFGRIIQKKNRNKMCIVSLLCTLTTACSMNILFSIIFTNSNKNDPS